MIEYKGNHYPVTSQLGQDIFIAEFLRRFDECQHPNLERYKKNSIRFIDIGAYDGVTLSNTRFLQSAGERGVCIEPSPSAVVSLLENTKNTNTSVVSAMVSSLSRENSMGPLIDWHDAPLVGSSNKQHVEKWSKGGQRFTPLTSAAVSCIDIANAYGPCVPVISIDAESDITFWIPDMPHCWGAIMVVETDGTDGHAKQIDNDMSAIGMRMVARLQWDTIYIADRVIEAGVDMQTELGDLLQRCNDRWASLCDAGQQQQQLIDFRAATPNADDHTSGEDCA